jgi:hypothetical protein
MRRIAIGTLTGVAIWIGSALAAEAQQITPTGPLHVYAGSTQTTYTADLYLPVPNNYLMRLWIDRGTTNLHYSQTGKPNPGTNNTTFSTPAGFNQAIYTGDVLVFKVAMKINGAWTPANYPINGETINWTRTVEQGTRPSKSTSVEKSFAVQNRPTLALQSIDRDRRRE